MYGELYERTSILIRITLINTYNHEVISRI